MFGVFEAIDSAIDVTSSAVDSVHSLAKGELPSRRVLRKMVAGGVSLAVISVQTGIAEDVLKEYLDGS